MPKWTERQQRIIQEILKNLPPEEAEKLHGLDPYQLRIRLLEYYQEKYPNRVQQVSPGDYNVEGGSAEQAASFAFSFHTLYHAERLPLLSSAGNGVR